MGGVLGREGGNDVIRVKKIINIIKNFNSITHKNSEKKTKQKTKMAYLEPTKKKKSESITSN